MGQVITGGLSYTCPILKSEADAHGISYSATFTEASNGQVYVKMNWSKAWNYCAGFGGGYRLASKEELLALYNAYGNMTNYAGWPTLGFHWSSTSADLGYYFGIALGTGGIFEHGSNSNGLASCVRPTN
ncbi:hypothetical protein D3C84_806960 [compost metagenome]